MGLNHVTVKSIFKNVVQMSNCIVVFTETAEDLLFTLFVVLI